MTLALLPLLALAAWQGALRFERERAATQLRLEDRAVITAKSRLNPIAATAALLKVLETNEDVRLAVQPHCATTLATIVATIPHVRAIAVHDARGVVACTGGLASAAAIPPLLPPPVASPHAGQTQIRSVGSPGDGEHPPGSLLLVLRQPDGRGLSAIIAPDWLAGLQGTLDGSRDYAVSLTDGRGRVLASSQPMDWSSLAIADDGGMRQRDANGRTWLHGRARLWGGDAPDEALWLVLSQSEPAAFDPSWLFNVSYVLLPFVALLLASLAIWIGADRTILRWVRDIGALADEIGRGQRLGSIAPFDDAPTEVRALAAQMKRVARIIAERDQRLRRAAAQERLSALELNHRIRNNLQMIGSWVALEGGRQPDGLSDGALGRVELRVAAIGMIHRLYFDAGRSQLDGPGVLLAPLGQLLERHGIGEAVTTSHDHAGRPLGIDMAMPLALWVIEAALALAPLLPAASRFHLDLQERDETIILTLGQDDGPDSIESQPHVPPMLQFMARQLGGTALSHGLPGAASASAPVSFSLVVPTERLELSSSFQLDMEQ